MKAIAAQITQTLDWATAKAALAIAQAAEDVYERDVWQPATDSPGGCRQHDPIEVELERLADLRRDAEDAMIAAHAPDVGTVLEKIEYARARWRDFGDWPVAWWDAVLADLRRLA